MDGLGSEDLPWKVMLSLESFPGRVRAAICGTHSQCFVNSFTQRNKWLWPFLFEMFFKGSQCCQQGLDWWHQMLRRGASALRRFTGLLWVSQISRKHSQAWKCHTYHLFRKHSPSLFSTFIAFVVCGTWGWVLLVDFLSSVQKRRKGELSHTEFEGMKVRVEARSSREDLQAAHAGWLPCHCGEPCGSQGLQGLLGYRVLGIWLARQLLSKAPVWNVLTSASASVSPFSGTSHPASPWCLPSTPTALSSEVQCTEGRLKGEGHGPVKSRKACGQHEILYATRRPIGLMPWGFHISACPGLQPVLLTTLIGLLPGSWESLPAQSSPRWGKSLLHTCNYASQTSDL
jgi:hypothetical protein